jgi:hypothetical protein
MMGLRAECGKMLGFTGYRRELVENRRLRGKKSVLRALRVNAKVTAWELVESKGLGLKASG